MNKLLLILLATFSFNVFAAVNLNTATKEELESLNGVGPVKAQAIIDYRKKNGDFKNVDGLDSVPGFGDVTMQKLKGDVSVNGKTTMSAPAAKDAKPMAKEAKTEKATAKEAKPAEKTAKEEKPAKAEKATAAADKPATAAKETAAEKKARVAEEKKVAKAAKAEAKAKKAEEAKVAKEAKAAEKAKKADEAKTAKEAKAAAAKAEKK